MPMSSVPGKMDKQTDGFSALYIDFSGLEDGFYLL